ncbi:MAG: SNF2-related protein [Halothiobacillaceae bacterium]
MTEAWFLEEFDPVTYERGRRYFREGRSIVLDCQEVEGDACVVVTATRGSGGRQYEQVTSLIATPAGPVVDGFCNCPVQTNCKHVVAGCLAWQAEARAGQASRPSEFEHWLSLLEDSAEAAAPAPDRLIYILEPERHGSGILVYFSIVRRKRDGSWGRGRSVRLSTLANNYRLPRYMQPTDVEIADLLQAASPLLWGEGVPLKGAAGRTVLELMAATGRLYWAREERIGPMQPGPLRKLAVAWHKEGARYQLRLDQDERVLMLPTSPPWYLDPVSREVGPLDPPAGIAPEKLALLDRAPPVDEREAERISRLLALRQPELPTPTEVEQKEVRVPPVPLLTLDYEAGAPGARLVLDFEYDGQRVAGDDPAPQQTVVQGRTITRLLRDRALESAAHQRLVGLGAIPGPDAPCAMTLLFDEHNRQAALAGWFDFLEKTVPELEAEGWRIEQTGAQSLSLRHADALDAEVQTGGNDWFDLRFDLEAEGQKLPLLPLVSDLLADYRPGSLPETLYLDAGEGQYISVPAARIEPVLQTIVDLYDHEQGGESLQLSRLDAPRLLDLGEVTVRGGHDLQQLARKLRDFEGIKPATIPPEFQGSLRAYQQQGVDWLQFLRAYHLGGILADDMGLGKTVQTLAHLAVEKHAGRMDRPSLIIAPTSLMGNWRREAAQFTPELKVLVLHGPDRSEYFEAIDDHDLVLTTYPLLPRDAEVLLDQSWYYLILDEAQQIKNPKSQAARLVRELDSAHRLCLTGTPMENHLGELWAQFDFLLPGFLGDQRDFSKQYRTPVEKQGDPEKLKRLNQRTAPFMLRRTKEQVAAELPRKTELLRTTPISGKQAALYESIRLTMEKRVREVIAKKGLARSHITVLDALLKLRQVCCDPRLLPEGTRGTAGAGSAKLDMLMELLPEMLEEGRRILLFSQFTTMLGIIEKAIAPLGIRYTKLTGQTRKREEAIARFRDGEVNLFLISLKAGGVGLNLTEADTVIHYDPWWNPAAEAQATDRAHRIGQEKPVFVYKLVTEGTVEEKILAMQARKQQLADNVYGKGDQEQSLPIDADAIQALLAAR